MKLPIWWTSAWFWVPILYVIFLIIMVSVATASDSKKARGGVVAAFFTFMVIAEALIIKWSAAMSKYTDISHAVTNKKFEMQSQALGNLHQGMVSNLITHATNVLATKAKTDDDLLKDIKNKMEFKDFKEKYTHKYGMLGKAFDVMSEDKYKEIIAELSKIPTRVPKDTAGGISVDLSEIFH